MVGRKSKVLVDSIDLEILEYLDRHPHTSVLDLAEKIDITHANLKKHIEKLSKSGLICPWESYGTTRITLSTIKALDEELETPNERKVIQEYESFLKIVRQINSQDWTKRTLASIARELREKKKLE